MCIRDRNERAVTIPTILSLPDLIVDHFSLRTSIITKTISTEIEPIYTRIWNIAKYTASRRMNIAATPRKERANDTAP